MNMRCIQHFTSLFLVTLCMLGYASGAMAQTDWFEKAKSARAAGNYVEAAEYLKQAYETTKAPVLLNNLGKVYEEMGNYAEAYATYKRVLEDPTASKDLKQLDRERMMDLEPKLTKAMLAAAQTLPWQRVWVNESAYAFRTGMEKGVEPEGIVVDIQRQNERLLYRMKIAGEPGRRLMLDESLTTKYEGRRGVLIWDQGSANVKSVGIDDVAIKASMDATDGVWLVPGRYVIQIAWIGQAPKTKTLTIEAGRALTVRSNGTLINSEIRMDGIGTDAQITTDNVFPGSAVDYTKWSQLTLGVVGTVMAATGTVVFMNASDDRERLVVQAQANYVPGTGSVDDDITNWQGNNDRLTDDMNTGLALVYCGTTALISGVVWWYLTQGRAPNMSVYVDGQGAPTIGGRF